VTDILAQIVLTGIRSWTCCRCGYLPRHNAYCDWIHAV